MSGLFQPVTLEGSVVVLEPLSLAHLDGLCRAGLDPALWEWTAVRVTTEAEMRAYVEEALAAREARRAIPFATVLKATREPVGSTRFGALDRENLRVEIGWTWVARPWQRSAVNTEAKLLMLTHAFESWGCRRVEFKTDRMNIVSRTALARLGAVEEGTLRSHMRVQGGRIRDSVYYSIIREEWPSVSAELRRRLSEPR